MNFENQHADRKSLRAVMGRTADWDALACDCVCFANGSGGRLLYGIEDGEALPSPGQRVPADLPDRLRKRIGELTVNVQALVSVKRATNGGEFVEIDIARSSSVASTTDGRYYLRIADGCKPVVGADVLRLANERPGYTWEAIATAIPAKSADPRQCASFVAGIRASDRVKASVREKSDDELLAHYGLAHGRVLTQLGVMLVGSPADRRTLGIAPLVQAIKYDEREQKINKWTWIDCELSPLELPDSVWNEIPDFRESYEISEGMYRRNVPSYDEKVVRELLVNALVHRPYTQQGDIYLNLHPDRLEVVNPGRLPLGVTPRNILHASRRRNDGMARVFHDLGLMEAEGSGYDLMYDRLLSQGRLAPVLEEGADWVKVTIYRRIVKPEVMRLIAEADARFQLGQRERITLGVLALSEGMTARELAEHLETARTADLDSWLGRLLKLGLVMTLGRTRGKRYFVDPSLLDSSGIVLPTSLQRIEPHRLAELVREDLRRYPASKIGAISARVGGEVPRSRLKRVLAELVQSGVVAIEGMRGTARYRLRQGP